MNEKKLAIPSNAFAKNNGPETRPAKNMGNAESLPKNRMHSAKTKKTEARTLATVEKPESNPIPNNALIAIPKAHAQKPIIRNPLSLWSFNVSLPEDLCLSFRLFHAVLVACNPVKHLRYGVCLLLLVQ